LVIHYPFSCLLLIFNSVSIVLSSLLLVRYTPPRLLDEAVLAGMGSGGSAKAKSGERRMFVVLCVTDMSFGIFAFPLTLTNFHL